MKRFPILILCLLITSMSINISAQKQTFSEDELKVLQKTTNEKLKNVSYRRTTTGKSFYPKESSSISIFEFVPPDRRHSIYEKESPTGMIIEETMFIWAKAYIKQGDERWKVITNQGIGGGSGIGFGSGSGSGIVIRPVITVVYELIRGVKVDNQTTDLNEVITTQSYNSDAGDYANIFKRRYWFNKDGLFVKTEYERSDSKSGVSYLSTDDYEYDPNIKIEAPIK